MNSKKKIVTVVVTYNGEKWIEKCINSLLQSYLQTDIIVIDNGSTDNTITIIKSFPKVRYIISSLNLGFGQANNLGIQQANWQYDFVFLLNQDAWVEKNTISELVSIAENCENVGIVSPIHLNGSGNALDYNFSQQLSPVYCASFYSDLFVNKLKKFYEIHFVNAAAWLISKECLKKVGFFEPIFFLYGEDNNYVQRLAYHKFKIVVTPEAVIYHDREIRKGKMNETGIKLWGRTTSLITLLNINSTYLFCIVLFFKEKIFTLLKEFKFSKKKSIAVFFKEIFFFSLNFYRLHKIRSTHKKSFT